MSMRKTKYSQKTLQ